MKFNFSFKKFNPNKFESEIHQTALIELQLINDIINKKIKVSDNLLKRCKKIKSKLIKFPNILNKIDSFKDIIDYPWRYEKLNKPKSKYRGKSSIRLTDFDRLIFDEREEGSLIIVEELFHYTKDWTDEYIENLGGDNLKLYKLLVNRSKKITKDEIKNLIIKSKRYPNKIWIF